MVTLGYFISKRSNSSWQSPQVQKQNKQITNILNSAKRIHTSDGWFEVIKLPKHVYAFFEPGHAEKMNSYLILGSKKDLLYDTGMGIANIKTALDEVRKLESLPAKEVIVVNSHSHLDHKGGNAEFPAIYIYKSQWAKEKQTTKLVPGKWKTYYSMLTNKPEPPKSFDPATFTYPPTKDSQIRYLKNGDEIDLGNRRFTVYITRSHTPDSIILYEPKQKMLFTGDAFGPDGFLVRDMDLLAFDLHLMNSLKVKYHYNTHGSRQLIAPGMRRLALNAMDKYQNGDYTTSSMNFAGSDFEVYTTGGFKFGFAPCLMMQAW